MNENYSTMFKNHSLNFIEMALRTDKIERIENPDGYGKRIGECGDSVEFFLSCHQNVLTTVFFCTKGCLNTNACCNTVAKFAQGKTIDKAWDIQPEQVASFLKTLPQDHTHCAELAVGALYRALANLISKNIGK
ncbi:MAG: iron-sulfur cluster assembly scaffold protein [Desulfobacteraceae bacterium]|nr:iron-sulfur cluster assembly scaffold protein [Desulfobacteraceae bacterium]